MMLDRAALAADLARLADPDDAVVLAAARAAAARLDAAGMSWEQALAPPPAERPAAPSAAPAFAPAFADAPDAEGLDDAAVLARLLALPKLSAESRAELEELGAALAQGPLDPMDRSYLRQLHRRLAR